jgi:inhibitor of KinA
VEIVLDHVKKILPQDIKISPLTSRKIKIPVCYSGKYALDIHDIAKEKKLTAPEIINLHTAKRYRVYMIGFLPGFAYMGEIDKRIAMPRKTQPRTKVEAGSVGIAGMQTGIYPFDSPGGWQIIGKTPVKLFDKEKSDPVLLQPGDEIEFYSITEDELANY